MEWIQVAVLAIIQGLSEFLPISSSGHLVLVPHFLGWPDQGLAFDVAIHVGTLLAVLVYFRADIGAILGGLLRAARERRLNNGAMLGLYLGFATIPVGLVGVLAGDFIEARLREPLFVAATLAFFGLLMWLADAYGRRNREVHGLRFGDAMLIGCAQALALMPGTSRSGVTMTAGLALGLTREAAARFSFLLAVPGIGAAGAWEGLHLARVGMDLEWSKILGGVLLSALTGYLCIHLLLRVLRSVGLAPFAIYRLVLAVVIVVVFGGA
ncbi:MAG: undecaprenyl-diphosphate phosphatase [Steroidobacteraceae bacterium]